MQIDLSMSQVMGINLLLSRFITIPFLLSSSDRSYLNTKELTPAQELNSRTPLSLNIKKSFRLKLLSCWHIYRMHQSLNGSDSHPLCLKIPLGSWHSNLSALMWLDATCFSYKAFQISGREIKSNAAFKSRNAKSSFLLLCHAFSTTILNENIESKKEEEEK